VKITTMSIEKHFNICHLHCLPKMVEPLGTVAIVWQRRNRLKRIFKRRWNYLINLFSGIISKKNIAVDRLSTRSKANTLKSGDLVRVRSKEQIQATLDNWNQLKGCSFMQEMWPYCGTNQKVFKRVEKFLDERDYLVKRCNGIVILQDVICNGTKDFGPCDRSCFFFWREEWLDKIKKT